MSDNKLSPLHPTIKPASKKTSVPERLRLLRWNELVTYGDFVEDSDGVFKLWEGPLGFQADSFVDPIYRQDKSRITANKKQSRPQPRKQQSPYMKVCMVGS